MTWEHSDPAVLGRRSRSWGPSSLTSHGLARSA